jgi:short-subunit dehydrogenase
MARALITGATAGIGAEFARQLAARGENLVLVARDSVRLDAAAARLSETYNVAVDVIVADLFADDDRAAVEFRVASIVDPIDILVNNAGFGLSGEFEANTVEQEQQMIDLLVAVPMRLTHAALAQMLPRHQGTVINIASVAGFLPRGTYGAAKAWVISFSRSANLSYRRRGVTVTVIAPGFVHTEFHQRMNVHTNNIPGPMWLSAKTLVRLALRDVARGRAVSVPSARYKVLMAICRVLPARVLAAGTLRPR